MPQGGNAAPLMNDYLILALDGLLYLASYCLLVGLTVLSVRLFYRGHLRAGLPTAALCVFLVAVGKNVLDSRAGAWLPDLDPWAQVAIGAGAGFVLAGLVVWWRYSIPLLSSAGTGLVLILSMYGVSFTLPWVSERVLPPGMRMAQFVDSAYSRTQQAREVAKQFKTVNETAPGVVATALSALADLSSKEEFESLKTQFRSGVKFYSDQKAAMDAMTPEERAAHRKAMAEFMAEQGIANDRYSLAALKHASIEDVQNLVVFMKEMQGGEPAAAAKAAPEKPVRPPAESMQIFLRNVRGMKFSEEDHKAMATLSGVFFEKGIDAAIAETRTDLVTSKLNPEWADTFLAALLETKSGLPMVRLASEPPPPEPVPAAPAAPVLAEVRMVSLPTKFGYLRVPKNTKNVAEISAAAETLPVTGFLSGGNQVRVALGKKSLGLGDVYTVNHGAKTYAFRMEEITDGVLHVAEADVN